MKDVWIPCDKFLPDEEYNGEKRERISYFIKADKQDDLPPWQEDSSGNTNNTPSSNTGYDIPF